MHIETFPKQLCAWILPLLQVDIKNQGRTALQVAAHLGRVEVVKILLQANANIDLRDEEGDAALHYAAFG